MKEDLDDFVNEERSDDDFDAFDEKDKQKKVSKKEEWDLSIDDEQDPLLEDEEEFDDDGNPKELDFGRYD